MNFDKAQRKVLQHSNKLPFRKKTVLTCKIPLLKQYGKSM